MSGSSGNIYSPNSANLGNQNSIYQSIGGSTASLNNYLPQTVASSQGITSDYLSNPYATGAQVGANNTSAYGTNTLAPSQAAASSGLSSLASQYGPYISSLLGQASTPTSGSQYASQALATGFAPNNGLYKQQLQQTQDQSNAINSMYGLGSSPYGAGVTDQATQNFDNNFNLNQANLQSAAANTYSTLMNQSLAQQEGLAGIATSFGNTAGSLSTDASNLGNAAYNTYAGSSALPSSTYSSNLTGDLSALSGGNSAVSGAASIDNQTLAQILSYLQYGTNATTTQQKESDNTFSGLGSLLGLGTGGGNTVGGDALSFIGL